MRIGQRRIGVGDLRVVLGALMLSVALTPRLRRLHTRVLGHFGLRGMLLGDVF